jgi:hypothetical protein
MTMSKVKQVVDPAEAAELPPAPTTPEAKPVRVVTFWTAFPRKLRLPSGGEVEFTQNKLTLTDEKLIDQLLPLCGDQHRLWQISK